MSLSSLYLHLNSDITNESKYWIVEVIQWIDNDDVNIDKSNSGNPIERRLVPIPLWKLRFEEILKFGQFTVKNVTDNEYLFSNTHDNFAEEIEWEK